MEKPTFVYVSYIATTPDKLWEALTSPEFSELYWGTRIESDWAVGSPVHLVTNGELKDQGVVLHFEAPKKLAYTFHVGWNEEMYAEGPSQVSFELEQQGKIVKLTVIHDGFEPGSKVYAAIINGWPAILSSLKSLMETNMPLDLSKE